VGVGGVPGRPRRCPPRLIASSASCLGRGRSSSEMPPPAAPGCSCAPTLRSGDPERRGGRGGAARAKARGRSPRGHRGLPTRPERGNALPAPGRLRASASRATPTRRGAPGTTKASATFKEPEALETNRKPWLV